MTDSVIAVLDIDGTLIDSDFQHALAGYRDPRPVGETRPGRRLIGVGGVQLLTAARGREPERRAADRAWDEHGRGVHAPLEERAMAPLPGARAPLVAVEEPGHRPVPAGTGRHRHAERSPHELDARARDVADDWTTSAHAETSRTAPDPLRVAPKRSGAPPDPSSATVGGSTENVDAARGAGMPAAAVRSVDCGDDEFDKAGALAVHHTPGDLAKARDDAPLA
ncbi:HAD family hydrolase [Streptomyces sp. NPDC006622]|uniref:HAD family hydrolase n=1 Tax=Streptomyces sp. NPDC006622 TaxID=3155459 RepID=UPI0033ADE87F